MVLQTPLRSVTIKSEKQMNDPAEKVTAIKPAARQKSQETLLKMDLRVTEKELKDIDKKVTAFTELEKEIGPIKARRTTLQAQLKTIKQDLIKELGLD